MDSERLRVMKTIVIFAIILISLPRVVLQLFFLWEDVYPYTLRDAQILRSIQAQAETGEIDLAEATPFEWDTVYYVSDIPLRDSIPALQDALGINLRGLRRIRYMPFDLPAGHGLIFVKDGKLVADCMLPLSCKLRIPAAMVVKGRQYFEITLLQKEQARLIPKEKGELHLEGVPDA